MVNRVKLDIKELSVDLVKVKAILAMTDNMATAEVCNMYIELCQRISNGIEVDEVTGSIIKRMSHNIDRANQHSISNHSNDPSETQRIAFEKENKDL